MKRMIQLGALVFLMSTASFAAGSWSGYMVDSKCYESTQRNVNAWSTSTVDRNMDLDIQRCAPTQKTKSFGLVGQDWTILKLDPAGNTSAAEFVRSSAKRDMYRVTITGETDRNFLKVDSIATVK